MAFWLSHHHPDEWNRTFVLGGARVCARCLGTYPALFTAIAVQFALGAPLVWRGDVALAVVLLLPALFDWALGRFQPQRGSNGLRFATGVLLGVALGRTLYVHLVRPFPTALWVQAAVVTAVAVPVILATYGRQRRS